MKTVDFKYTDAKDRVTNRSLAIISEPSNKYFGIDITELSASDAGEIIAELHEAMQYHKAELEHIMEKYDIKCSFRYFFADKMEDINYETH